MAERGSIGSIRGAWGPLGERGEKGELWVVEGARGLRGSRRGPSVGTLACWGMGSGWRTIVLMARGRPLVSGVVCVLSGDFVRVRGGRSVVSASARIRGKASGDL